MRNKILSLVAIAALSVSAYAGYNHFQPKETPAIAGSCCESANATCSGTKSCTACKNCKYCKHCSKNGGSCGVCKK